MQATASMSTSLWKTLYHLNQINFYNSNQFMLDLQFQQSRHDNWMYTISWIFQCLSRRFLNWFTLFARITLSGKLFHMLTIRLVKQYFHKSNLRLITVSFQLLPLVWCCPMVAISNWSAHRIVQIAACKLWSCLPCSYSKPKLGDLIASISLGT